MRNALAGGRSSSASSSARATNGPSAKFGMMVAIATVGWIVGATLLGCGKVESAEADTTPPLADEHAADADAGTHATERSWLAERLAPDPSRRQVTTPPECSGLPGTDEELAMTPRADGESEKLALLVDDTFVATSTTYERIRRDLASIRAHVPETKDVLPYPQVGHVSLYTDLATLTSMESGAYTAWDCLRARYGWIEPSWRRFPEDDGIASAALGGYFDLRVLRPFYEGLPSMTAARIDAGFSLTSLVCATRESDASFHYVLSKGSGDCPAGCILWERYYFVSDEAGQITWKGSYETGPDASPPDWVKRYGQGENCN